MVKKVTLYVDKEITSQNARNYLINRNVGFQEVDATTPEGRARLVKQTRQDRLPCIEVRGSGVHISSGFEEFRYASALDATLSYDRWIVMKKMHISSSDGGKADRG